MTFVHLHNHSEFSPLDGLQRPVGMCREAKRQGAPAVAFTDHGTLAAAPAMAAAGLEVGIPVIGGVEAYVAVGSRWSPDTIEGVADSDAEGDRVVSRYHLTLLAKSQQGWNNLVRLTNEASQSVKSYPLMDFELLKQYSDGLIIGTGCLGGPLSVALRSRGGYQAGLEIVAQLLDILDGDTERLFMEVMDHGIPDERALLPMQVAIADHYGLRMVATNDAHYTHIDQCEDHDRWLAIGSSKHLDDPKRFRFHGAGYHMRTSEEILEAFSWAKEILGDRDIIGTSVEIANMVEGTLADFLPASRPRMPKFPVTNPVTLAYAERDGVSPQNRLLRELVGTGAVKRFCDPNDPHPTLPQVVKDRLKFEFDVISKFGYEDYFLIVNDWIAWARNEGYPAGPGRGSAAGSLVAFCLQITDVDPLKHNLLFERFLDVTRLDPPDIDIDFPEALFNRAVGYLQGKYGYEHVAQIGTFSSKKAKSLVRDLGRLTGYASLGATLAEMVPDHADVTLTDLLRTDPDPENENQVRWSLDGAPLRAQMEEDDMSADLVEQAVAIEGTKSYPGIHACGVVLSDEPLLDILPMRKDKRTASTGEDGKPDLRTAQWVTIWDSNPLAAMGFTKFDRLGLKSLDIIAAAKEHVEKVTGEPIDLAYGKLPMDGQTDERARRTWELLAAGDTAGLFQLGSSGMTKLVKGIAPTCLDDLSAAVALYRPGPMGAGMHNRYVARRRGQEEISYEYLTSNPAEAAVLAGVLDKSLGLIVVQEDLMSLARDVAGFGPDKRNKLRKAFSKKKKADMDALKEIFFRQGAIATLDNPETDTAASIPFGEHTLKELWRTFEASASYLFNACLPGDTQISGWTVGGLYDTLYGRDDAAEGECAGCLTKKPASETAIGWVCLRCARIRAQVAAGDLTLTAYNHTRSRFEQQTLRDVHCHGAKPLVRIELADGTVVRSTTNHQWMTAGGYRPVEDFDDELLMTQRGLIAIVSITPDGEELVYDVEMAEGTDHNFVANGVVSHNSHSAPYAYIGYMTAYLKANWPAHFAAAQLTVTTDKDRRLPVLDSVRRSGVTVLGPSLAAGNLDTAVEGSHTVRLGLSEIAGVKDNAAKLVQIIERNGGPFKTLGDLLRAAKVDDKFIPSNVFEGLIDAGALDEYGTRRGMSCVLRALREYPDLPIPTIEWSVAERAARERARLGIIVGRHPLSEMQAQVRAWNPHPDQAPCVPVAGLSPCPVVTTKAMVSEWTIGHTRGREFARFTIEGSTGSISGVLWPESLEKARLANGLRDPKPGDIVCMRGRVKISAMGDVDEDDSTDEQLEMIGSAFWLGTHFVSVSQDNLAPVRALHVASMFSVPAMQPDVSSPQEPVDVVEVEDEADADAASNVFQLFPVQLQPVIQTAPEPVPDPIPVTPSAPPPAHSGLVPTGGSSHESNPLIISMTSSVAVSVRNSSRKLAREMKSVLVPGAEVTAIAEDLSNLNLHHRVSRDGFQLEVTPDKYPVTRPCVVLVDGGPKARESDIA